MAGFFHDLSPAKLETLGDVYSPGIEFQDPLYKTRGLSALRTIYERMFSQLTDIRITVSDIHGDDRTGFMLWTMRYIQSGKERSIKGASHLRLAPDGRIAAQHNFWDASFPVYGEIPLLGWAMRRFRKQSGYDE
jgi:hypothetical protein